MFVTNPIAIIGEKEAAKLLEKKGFRIVERNWRMGHLEVDLIAESRQEIVFAEVKARTSTFANKRPEDYVDTTKKRHMVTAANAYIKYKQIEKQPRFDIIGILIHPKTNEIIYSNHIEKAFLPPLRTITGGSYSGKWRWTSRNKKK